MEFQLGVGVLNFLCMVTLRIKQGETKKEWNGKVQIGAGGDSETERDRIKDWGWRRNGSGRVGRRQKGKGGGHEAAVERELRPGKRVTFKSSREPLESLSPCGSKQIDMNQKNKSYFVLCWKLERWMTRNHWMAGKPWGSTNGRMWKCEVATSGRAARCYWSGEAGIPNFHFLMSIFVTTQDLHLCITGNALMPWSRQGVDKQTRVGQWTRCKKVPWLNIARYCKATTFTC